MGSVVDHPLAALMREVEAERAVAATPEATALIENIWRSISAYWDYLDREGLIYDDKRKLMKALALQIIHNECGCDIVLKGGAIDRRYK